MVDSGQFPNFEWPSHEKSLEDDPELSAGDMMIDSFSTEGQLPTNIFTATKGILARATKEITSDNSLKENAISVDVDTHSRSSSEKIVESLLSTQKTFFQPSRSEELSSLKNPINEITKMISNVVSQEKNSTSTEPPIKVYPEFRINMNTNSSNNIDTMKNVFTETMLKERGLLESGTNEKTMSTASNTIETLRNMFSKATAREKPLLDDVKTESSLTEFSTSTQKPLLETFSLKDILQEENISASETHLLNVNTLSAELPITENVTIPQPLIETGANTSSTIDITGFFNGSTSEEMLTQNLNEKMADVISTPLETEETSIEFIQSTTSLFKELNSTEEIIVENASNLEKIKDLVSSTTEFNEIIDFSQSNMDKIEDMLSTTRMAQDSMKTSDTTDMISDMFIEPTKAINDFEKLTDLLSSTDISSIDLDNTKFNSTMQINMFQKSYSTKPTVVEEVKDMFSTYPTQGPSSEFSQNKLEKIKDIFTATSQTNEPFLRDIVSTTLTENASMDFSESSSEKINGIFSSTSKTVEPSLSFGWSTGINGSTNLVTDVFNESNEITYHHPQNIFHELKKMLSTTNDPSIELNLRKNINSTADLMADIFSRSTPKEQMLVLKTNVFDRLKNILPKNLSMKNSTFEVGKNRTVKILADVFNISTSTEDTVLNASMENIKDIFLSNTLTNTSTKQNSIEFDLSTQASSSNRTISDVLYRSTPMKQIFENILKEMKNISTTISTGESPINLITSTDSNIMRDTTMDQSVSLNSTTNISVPELTSVSTTDLHINANSIFNFVKTISNNKTIFEKPIQMYTHAPTSTVDFFNMFNGDASTEIPLQLKLNRTAVTTNSTYIFSTQSTSNTNFSKNILGSIELTEKIGSGSSYHISTTKKTIEDIFSTISSNNNSPTEEIFYATDEKNQTGIESDLTLYISVGVILIVSIIFIIGGYILCRKCKKNSKSPAGYYSTHLKDYSDSSVKTVSETDTLNIRL